ncbi:MAG: recombination mediator RecR [Anaerolineales bacterium]|nr:recombination mediator RecR [Anaerolineales bacterium]
MAETIPRAVQRLMEALGRLPGIGPKTASRLTYHLLRAPESEAADLGQAVLELHRATGECPLCFNIMQAGSPACGLCSDPARNDRVVCVVEDPLDVLAIERSGAFGGRYHVLQGVISPVEGVGPEDLKIEELVQRVASAGVDEVIVATNPTLEGEATAIYLKRRLQGLPVRVTRLARGLPSGGDLEYADTHTLARALEGRSEL